MVKSLLYTPEEIADYERMLLGPTSERAVTRQFSSYYWQITGDHNPHRGSEDFKWRRMLQDTSTIITDWWEGVKEWLPWWGSVWGCCSCCLTVIRFLSKVGTVLCHMKNTNLEKGQLVRFIFTPGQELVKLFLARAEPNNVPRAKWSAPEPEGVELQLFLWGRNNLNQQ